MKIENQLRLARIASNDVWGGGCKALSLVSRMKKMCDGDGTWKADQIVSRIYASSDGKAVFRCGECGQEWAMPEDCNECCSEQDT